MNSKWWKDGIRFECQGSGKCCTSRGEYGFVYLTKLDRKQMAAHLGVTTSEFVRKYCDKTEGNFHLKEDPKNPDCMFLEGNRCGVYQARPTQCRTWPFWPETMSAKSWRVEVAANCPGVGKGRLIPADEIARQLELQTKSENYS